MKRILLFALCVVSSIAAMDRDLNPDSEVLKKAKKLHEEMHRNCNKSSIFDYITNPWVPTGIFVSTALYEGIKSYRNNSFPSLTSIKHEFDTGPKIFFAGSLILLSCMVYSYYKPRINSLCSYVKGVYSNEKKTTC